MRAAAAKRVRHAIASSYLEQHPAHTAAFVVIAGALAAGALIGLAFVAGPGAVLHRLAHPNLYWLPIAFGATVMSYLGYMLAYRECACAGSGPDLPMTHVGTLVAGGFGLFIPRGGFTLDVDALELAPGTTPILVGRQPTDLGPFAIALPTRNAGRCWGLPPR